MVVYLPILTHINQGIVLYRPQVKDLRMMCCTSAIGKPKYLFNIPGKDVILRQQKNEVGIANQLF